jgi:serine/threonine protein kinase
MPLLSLEHRLALPAGFRLERYQILRTLGTGGFGITYLAEARPYPEVAIKELFPREFATRTDGYRVSSHGPSGEEKLTWAKQRFLEEAQILERLHHPNIVPVERYFELLDTAYLVMKFIPGQHLKEWMKAHPRPTEAELTRILLPLLDGLEYMHQQNLLHRDVSPENVIIANDGRPILLDFGSARMAFSARKLTTVVRPGYSPIEQYQSLTPQGPYTDIYALASLAVQAVTRKEPPQAVDRAGARDPFTPLSARFRGKYSKRFLEALDAGFAVSPANRPQNVAAWRQMFPKSDPHQPSPNLKNRSRPELTTPVKPVKAKGTAKKAKPPKTARKTKRSGLIWLLSMLAIAATAFSLFPLIWKEVRPGPQTPTPGPTETPPAPMVSSVTPTALTATIDNPFVNSLGMKFVPVPAANDKVILFCIHQTRRQDYAAIMGDLPKPEPDGLVTNDSPDAPVVNLTQGEAKQFCLKLSVKEKQPVVYRLPTKEEWDRAFGNQHIPWPPIADREPLGNYLDVTGFNFLKNKISAKNLDYIQGYSDGFETTAPVMRFRRNQNKYGLFDMGSNVEEWCADETHVDGDLHLFHKGASWLDSDKDVITNPTKADKIHPDANPETRLAWVGFRCVREAR